MLSRWNNRSPLAEESLAQGDSVFHSVDMNNQCPPTVMGESFQ